MNQLQTRRNFPALAGLLNKRQAGVIAAIAHGEPDRPNGYYCHPRIKYIPTLGGVQFIIRQLRNVVDEPWHRLDAGRIVGAVLQHHEPLSRLESVAHGMSHWHEFPGIAPAPSGGGGPRGLWLFKGPGRAGRRSPVRSAPAYPDTAAVRKAQRPAHRPGFAL